MFQDAVVDHPLTGRQKLELHMRLWGVRQGEGRPRLAELAKTVGIDDILDRPVATYSGGQRRRTEIVRALLSAPRVLFLDEPTVGLDTVPIGIAGGCPGCPAAPNGRGLPGRAVVPAGPVWSYAPGGAAVGPGGCRRSSARCCGWRVLGWQLSGGRSSGLRRSRLPVAAPGARGRAARSPRRRRDGR